MATSRYSGSSRRSGTLAEVRNEVCTDGGISGRYRRSVVQARRLLLAGPLGGPPRSGVCCAVSTAAWATGCAAARRGATRRAARVVAVADGWGVAAAALGLAACPAGTAASGTPGMSA